MFKAYRISSQSGSYSADGSESGFLSYPQHEVFLSIASDNSRHSRIGVFPARKKVGWISSSSHRETDSLSILAPNLPEIELELYL